MENVSSFWTLFILLSCYLTHEGLEKQLSVDGVFDIEKKSIDKMEFAFLSPAKIVSSVYVANRNMAKALGLNRQWVVGGAVWCGVTL